MYIYMLILWLLLNERKCVPNMFWTYLCSFAQVPEFLRSTLSPHRLRGFRYLQWKRTGNCTWNETARFSHNIDPAVKGTRPMFCVFRNRNLTQRRSPTSCRFWTCPVLAILYCDRWCSGHGYLLRSRLNDPFALFVYRRLGLLMLFFWSVFIHSCLLIVSNNGIWKS